MRSERIDRSFLVVARTDEEALRVEAALRELVTPAPVPPVPPPMAIDTADVLASVSAEHPFAQQPFYNPLKQNLYAGFMRASPSLSKIPETGVHGQRLSNGETLRFGKEPDPVDPSRKVLTMQLAPIDGDKHAELGFPRNVEMNKVYWIAVSVYVHDWSVLPSGDQSLFGFQLHPGTRPDGVKLDLSPTIALYEAGTDGRSMQIQTRHSVSASPSQGNTLTKKWPELALPFGRWMDFVVKFKESLSDQGFAQVWKDGELIVDYRGHLGFNIQGGKDFVKFGYYNWTSFNSPRKVRLRNPTLVLDPSGSKYPHTALREFINRK